VDLSAYRRATWLMWLALPATAFIYWRAWDRLPARIAVHFDASWRPNGWAARDDALHLSVGIVGFLLVVFTFASFSTQARKPGSAGPVLFLSYLVLALHLLVTNWMVQRGLPP
jgi:uncharacterized membrane protein